LTGYVSYVSGNDWYGEYDNWFNGLDRKLYNLHIGSANAGTIQIGLYTISGTTATFFSSKSLTVVSGENIFSLAEISDTTPVIGTKYFIFVKVLTTGLIGYKADNTSKGRHITFDNPTILATNNFSISYFLKLRQDVFTNNSNFNLVNEIASKNNVFIPEGIHTITSKIILRSGQKIQGIRGKSIIFNATGLTECIEINSVEDIKLSDFTLKGNDADTIMSGNDVASTVVTDFANAISRTNLGVHNGIVINNSKGVQCNNIEVSNFNGYGIKFENYGNVNPKTSKFTDVFIHNCYAGLGFLNQGEYNTINGLHVNRCQFGVIVDAGNNTFNGCNISWNRVNWMFLGGVNNAHGSINGGSFNHSSLASFIFSDVA